MGCSSYFGSNQYKFSMGCSSVWVTHAYLGQTSTNGHGLLFSVGYSCPFGSNQYKWHVLLFSLGYSCHFGSKSYQKDMGCSSVWVAHAHLGQNIIKKTWVALQFGLLKLFWVKPLQIGCGLLFSMGCSCQNTLLYQYTEPTLIAGLLRLLMGCSVALQRDPKVGIE